MLAPRVLRGALTMAKANVAPLATPLKINLCRDVLVPVPLQDVQHLAPANPSTN